MATVTGYTSTRMKEIEDAAIIDGDVVGNDLILTRYDTTQINAGSIKGSTGVAGPAGPTSIVIVTSTTRPTNPVEGLMIYETDTDKIYTWDGTSWTLPKNVAGGILGVPGTTIVGQSVTTETDLTGLTVTATIGASRRIKLSYHVVISRSVLDGYSNMKIKEGVNVLSEIFITNDISGIGESRSGFVLLTPSVGLHTYKLSLTRGSGTGTSTLAATATYPAFFIVEDVGGV